MRFSFLLLLLAWALIPIVSTQAADSLGQPTSFALAQKPYLAHLALNKIEFDVSSTNANANANENNFVVITAKGIKNQSSPINTEVPGRVTGAEVADLNNDGYPEVYVYLNALDANRNGSVLAFASNKNLSLTPIFMPALSDSPKMTKGYQGQDEFAVVENKLMRRFPIGAKTNPQHYRQIQYRLVAGEAGWVLKPERVDEF